MTLENLTDTAYWMAYMRALESDRPDALFKDPYSRQLAGHRGAAVSQRLGSIELIATSIAVRTAVLDRLILDMVYRLNIGSVLNIGSGLDTRPWRLSLPPQLTWIDVDQPAVLDHKIQTLSESTHHLPIPMHRCRHPTLRTTPGHTAGACRDSRCNGGD